MFLPFIGAVWNSPDGSNPIVELHVPSINKWVIGHISDYDHTFHIANDHLTNTELKLCNRPFEEA